MNIETIHIVIGAVGILLGAWSAAIAIVRSLVKSTASKEDDEALEEFLANPIVQFINAISLRLATSNKNNGTKKPEEK